MWLKPTKYTWPLFSWTVHVKSETIGWTRPSDRTSVVQNITWLFSGTMQPHVHSKFLGHFRRIGPQMYIEGYFDNVTPASQKQCTTITSLVEAKHMVTTFNKMLYK